MFTVFTGCAGLHDAWGCGSRLRHNPTRHKCSPDTTHNAHEDKTKIKNKKEKQNADNMEAFQTDRFKPERKRKLSKLSAFRRK
jgi:hypothetical protein